MVRDGQEVAPGLTAMATPGHTLGHHAFRISSNGASLINTGDLIHHHVLAFEHPEWRVSFDTDPDLGAQSRMRLLDMLAAERAAALVYHCPFPGYGHVVRQGAHYAWAPMPMEALGPD